MILAEGKLNFEIVEKFQATSKNVIPARVKYGVNSSGNLEAYDITGLPRGRE